jgi:hypothetical protein
MLWSDSSPSKGTQRNRRIRGNGTWGEQVYNLHQAEQKKFQRQRGKGSWGSQTARLYREERRREREERRSKSLVYRLLG